MIQIGIDKLIPLRDVPRQLPPRQSGKSVHISAVYRWVQRGVRGVHLETVTVGGTTYTSAEALQRFAEALSGTQTRSPVTPSVSSSKRQKQIDDATRQVEEMLRGGRRKHNRRDPAVKRFQTCLSQSSRDLTCQS